MRPVERGPCPLDEDGNEKEFHPYQNAKAELLDRLGDYCSYCERTGDLDIEHVVPRKHRPDLAEDWGNFLLGCRNCNRTKWYKNESRCGYLWPDRDDTRTALEYLSDGRVRVREGLPGAERAKAEKLMALVGLDRVPRKSDPRASDRRWSKRRQVWRQAETARLDVEAGADVRWVMDLAKALGFWSVWMTVFADDDRICARLCSAFPGTRATSSPGSERAGC